MINSQPNNTLNNNIGVIVPTFKRPEDLERAVFSVLNQTVQNLRVLISDNGNSCEFIGHNFAIAWTYLGHILCISGVYLGHI